MRNAGGTAWMSNDIAAALRACIAGAVLTADEPRYSDARRVFNAAVDRQPDVIVQVAKAEDVALTYDLARRSGLAVSVRGGGADVSGAALRGDIVIDLCGVRGVRVDPAQRLVHIRGGATWADVDAATQAYGLAVPGSRISHVGVGGHTLRGGEGWLSRRHGWTRDQLRAADVITADGQSLHVSPAQNTETYEALVAGLADGLAVLSFTFDAHPVPRSIRIAQFLFRLADSAEVLSALDDQLRAGDTDAAPAAYYMTAPAARYVPGDIVGRPVLTVVLVGLGNAEDTERAFALLRSRVRPLAETTTAMSYAGVQSMLDANAPWGLRQRWALGSAPTFDQPLLRDLEEAAATLPGPTSHVALTPHPSGTSWLLRVAAQWRACADDERHAQWVDILAPHCTHLEYALTRLELRKEQK